MGRIAQAGLSPQQSRCLELVGEGLTTKEIAFALKLSENTVDEHVKKAMTKLGAPNRARAAALHRASKAPATPLAASPPSPPPPPPPPAPATPPPNAPELSAPGHPPSLGVGISPVGPTDVFEASHPATMLLRDSHQARFEGLALSPMPPRQSPETEPDRDVHDRLTIISKVLTISGAIVLILVAAPALVNGAEQIATWLRTMVQAQP